MINYKKIIACTISLGLCLSFAACSDTEETTPRKELSPEEINSQYEALMSSAEKEENLPENYNPIVDSFTSADFQFTTTDDTVAFNLPENSFTKITASGAFFNFINSESSGETFEGAFKTAKGFSLANTRDEFIASYKLAPEFIYAPSENVTAFGFSSADGYEFSALSASQVQTVIDMRNALSANEDIAASVPGAKTVSVIELTADETGAMSEYTIWRFDVSVEPESTANQS